MRHFPLPSGLLPLLFSLLLLASASLAGTVASVGDTKPEQLQQPWSALLRLHVMADGRLDYDGLLNDEDELLGYLQSLRKVRPQVGAWTPDQIKAFWLNTYNAAAANLVLENYPVASINDIRVKTVGGYESPWETVVVNVGGQNYSLNQIEQLLRQQFRDPRIHFALNYGAASAAPMLAEAYTGPQLSRQLDQQASRFINDSAFNQLSPQQVLLSALFCPRPASSTSRSAGPSTAAPHSATGRPWGANSTARPLQRSTPACLAPYRLAVRGFFTCRLV